MAEALGGLSALIELKLAGQYEGHARAPFDVGSLDSLHALHQLRFVSLVRPAAAPLYRFQKNNKKE